MSTFTTFNNRHSESLLRKTDVHLSSRNIRTPTPDSVTISKSEYEQLLQASSHFKKLKGSLLNGGLSQETLDILIYGSPPPPQSHQNDGLTHPGNASESHGPRKSSADTYQGHSNGNSKLTESFEDDDEDDAVVLSQSSDEREEYEESSRSAGSLNASTYQRTVMIRGLPDRVTHQDIVEAVRGGVLLHVYLRAREHTASVSFVEEAAARGFLQYTKTYGVYVGGKRVEVSWNDRQFYLPPYVKAKINNGASRNLVIYNVNASITEWHIRRDLEHIHNLIVITVKFKQGNAYISTNSVHNTLFARSCMMSRFTYKGMRIGFYPDECAESLAKTPTGPKKELQVPSKKAAAVPNRFQLLSLDGQDDESDDHESFHDGLNNAHLNDGINWVDNSVSA